MSENKKNIIWEKNNEEKIKQNKNYFLFYSFILLIFINIGIIFAQEPNSYNYIKLELESDIKLQINIENNLNIEYFYLNSYFFPQIQKDFIFINEIFSSNEKFEIKNENENEYISFSYNKNSLKENLNIKNKITIESLKYQPKIKEKYQYPILNNSKKEYLEFTGLIDIDQNIQNQASNLANGHDDVFIIASIIAKWIREDIIYDLSTIAENPNQKSSEVFKSKVGVCKEITNLYVSMMRSLGIPARVVSGFAYTNSQEVVDFVGSNWGGHAWAEVYISGEWVPFDLTYNQYGFVDVTHIPTYKGLEVKSQSVSLNSKGFGYTLVPNSLEIDYNFNIIDKKNINFEIPYEIKISGPDKLAPQSYGHIQLDVKNTKNYYQIIFLNLAKANEIELLDLNHKMIILKPFEEKKVFFRYKIPQLDSNYIYTMPFKIYNEIFEQNFNVEIKKDHFLIEKLNIPEDEQIETSLSSNNPQISCSFILEKENNLLICTIHNQNNYELNNFEICSSNSCQKISLKVNGKESINFETKNFQETIFYTFENKKFSFKFNLEKPKINYILNITNQIGIIETQIENFQQGLILNIYNNNKLIFSTKNKQENKTIIFLEGKHNLKGELLFENRILDEFETSFETKKPTLIQQIKEFFSKLKNSFKILFLN